MSAIQIVRAGELPEVTAGVSTERWTRRVAEFDDRVAVNQTRNEPGSISQWHHHGDNAGYVYVLQGRLRLEWGPGGRETADLQAGDCYVIRPNTIHRESNPGSGDQVLVAWVVGSGPRFVDVDGSDPG